MPKITIRRQIEPSIEGDYPDLRAAVIAHKYELDGADLSNIDLSSADLRAANFSFADLRGASFSDADLRDTIFSNADLRGANFSSANLLGANFSGADLRGANFGDADLLNANFSSTVLRGAIFSEQTILPTGEPWDLYLSKVVPDLLTAGGKSLAKVLKTGCWECHSWANCPMHAAFGAESIDEVPLLHQPRARQFIQLFDAGLIPKPEGL